MNWLKGNGYSALVSWRCYSGNKIRNTGCCSLSSVNKKQDVNRLIRSFPHAAFYWQRRYGRGGSGHIEACGQSPFYGLGYPPPSLTLDSHSAYYTGSNSPHGLVSSNEPKLSSHNGWGDLTCFFFLFFFCKSTWFNNCQQPQLPITTEGKHHNSVTVIVPSIEYDTQGTINDQTHPRTPNMISCLWASLLCLCSSIGVETDLWLLNLQVIKRKKRGQLGR